MRRLLKILAFTLIAAGILVGPAYWIYSKFYTGSEAALITLKADETKPGLARTWRSEPFKLAEDMAPVGLILVAQGHFSPNMDENRPPQDRYSATLALDGQDAKPLTFTLGAKTVSNSNPAFREHMLLMNKVQPGQYTLTVAQAAEPAIEMDRMQLQVRQHLQEPNPDIMMAGLAMLILGILALTMF
ncbi:MAG: hypothetical protein HGA75_04020 [Thiobacillus sp.]|nr:hypothetical protein [Thiobacillus sp.]